MGSCARSGPAPPVEPVLFGLVRLATDFLGQAPGSGSISSRAMRAGPSDDLLALLAETNDLRRDVGRVLVALDRALVLWKDRGKGLHAIVRGWAPGAAQALDRA